MVGGVGLETVDDSDMCVRAECARRPEDLRGVSAGAPETRASTLTSQRPVTPMLAAVRARRIDACGLTLACVIALPSLGLQTAGGRRNAPASEAVWPQRDRQRIGVEPSSPILDVFHT